MRKQNEVSSRFVFLRYKKWAFKYISGIRRKDKGQDCFIINSALGTPNSCLKLSKNLF